MAAVINIDTKFCITLGRVLKDIPTGMEEDDNFNTKMNILLILDDLFSESGKD
jgi:hypothetical protein